MRDERKNSLSGVVHTNMHLMALSVRVCVCAFWTAP